MYRLGAYYNDGETNPSAFLSYGDAGDRFEWNTSINYQKRFNRKAATELERALDGEGGPEPAFAAVVEDPDERESEDIAWTGDLRGKVGDGGEWFLGGFYMDTDREETEIGREFAAEDDDGEFEAEAEQANQLDAFRETNYGAVTGYESSFGDGHSWNIELGYDQTEFESVETNWVDDLDFDFDDAGITDADSLLAFLAQPDQDIIDLFADVPHNAEGLRDPEFLDGEENTDADDAELSLRSSVTYQLSGSKLKFGLEGSDRSRDFSFRVFEMDDGVLEENDDALSLFDAKDQRVNGLVKWTMDFSSSTLEIGGRGEFTHPRDRLDGFRCPCRGGRRAAADRPRHQRQPGQRHGGHLRVQPERPLPLGRCGQHAAAPLGRAHRAPAELRPAEPDAAHRRRGEHPRQPGA